MTDIVCPNCSNSNPEGTEICEYCGTALVEGAVPTPAEEPEAEAPDAGAPEAEAPEAEAPEAEAPEDEAPEDKAPEDEAPEAEAPEAEFPLPDVPAGDEASMSDEATAGDAAEEGQVPDWLQKIREREAEANGEAAPETTPALVPEDGESDPLLEEDFLEDPDWLDAIEHTEESQGPAAQEGAEESGIQQATLPSWVEAMRPVDTFRAVEPEDREEMSVESVGPLAGLRGVLLAEPVVALPRTSAVGSMQLDVTERQYTQAEMLQAMVAQEESEPSAADAGGARLPLFRWLISAITVLAVAVPVIGGTPTYAPPRWTPQEFEPLVQMVNDLPVDQPALIVFDYEPAYSGELEAVSGALIEHLAGRGVPLASMTTRPAGAPMAEVVIAGVADRHGYEAGQDYINLGFVSGGPIAVQVFAAEPRNAILQGYALPESLTEGGASAWDSPVLAGVTKLEDFSMVAVVTAGTETARVWVEQTDQFMGDTPLVMVVSAGAEPLVRPYFEQEQPQVDAILTGIPTTYEYERRNSAPGRAQGLWNSFGSGIVVANFVLLAGLIYGSYAWWASRREG